VEPGYSALVVRISVVVPADTALTVKHSAARVSIGRCDCQKPDTDREPVGEDVPICAPSLLCAAVARESQ
jgi:hypothetical protein